MNVAQGFQAASYNWGWSAYEITYGRIISVDGKN
jgi:hypothetical protein